MYLPSLFNIYIHLQDSEQVLVFNSLKGSAALLPFKFARRMYSKSSAGYGPFAIFRHFDESLNYDPGTAGIDAGERRDHTSDFPSDIRESLLEAGLIAAHGHAAEFARVKEKIESDRFAKVLKLTLAYTHACQLSCSYCFQYGTTESKTDKSDLLRACLAWIEDYLDQHKELTEIHLGLFGGEPLIDVTTANAYIYKLKNLADKRSMPLSLSLTTNGVNLDPALISAWTNEGLKNLRITMDGPPPVHNKRRPFRSGEGSFEKILTNLKAISSLGEFSIGICINVDRENVFHIGALLDILAENELKEEVEIIVEPVLPRQQDILKRLSNNEKTKVCNNNKFLKAALFQIMEKGFHTPVFPGLCAPCNLVQEHSFIIDWSGQIFACTFTMTDSSAALGSVFSGLTPQSALRRSARKAISYCYDHACSYLPFCAGACRYLAWCEQGNFAAESCPIKVWDQTLPLSIAHRFKSRPLLKRDLKVMLNKHKE